MSRQEFRKAHSNFDSTLDEQLRTKVYGPGLVLKCQTLGTNSLISSLAKGAEFVDKSTDIQIPLASLNELVRVIKSPTVLPTNPRSVQDSDGFTLLPGTSPILYRDAENKLLVAEKSHVYVRPDIKLHTLADLLEKQIANATLSEDKLLKICADGQQPTPENNNHSALLVANVGARRDKDQSRFWLFQSKAAADGSTGIKLTYHHDAHSSVSSPQHELDAPSPTFGSRDHLKPQLLQQPVNASKDGGPGDAPSRSNSPVVKTTLPPEVEFFDRIWKAENLELYDTKWPFLHIWRGWLWIVRSSISSHTLGRRRTQSFSQMSIGRLVVLCTTFESHFEVRFDFR